MIRGVTAPCELYTDGGKGKPCTLPENQAKNLATLGRPCPLVVPLPVNVNVIGMGEISLDNTEPEAVKADAWELYTLGMNRGQRLEFARRTRFYRSLRLRERQAEQERKANQGK